MTMSVVRIVDKSRLLVMARTREINIEGLHFFLCSVATLHSKFNSPNVIFLFL